MPIERNNSFHLMLSDDELSLLKMLAEQKGLNASDYLRMVIREGGGPGNVARLLTLGALLEKGVDLRESWDRAKTAAAKVKKR
jgi:hypothetical protein